MKCLWLYCYTSLLLMLVLLPHLLCAPNEDDVDENDCDDAASVAATATVAVSTLALEYCLQLFFFFFFRLLLLLLLCNTFEYLTIIKFFYSFNIPQSTTLHSMLFSTSSSVINIVFYCKYTTQLDLSQFKTDFLLLTSFVLFILLLLFFVLCFFVFGIVVTVL